MRQGRVKASRTSPFLRSHSASPSGTLKRLRNNSSEPEKTFQDEGSDALTERPLDPSAGNGAFSDMVFEEDDFLMNNGFPDFAFMYPSASSNSFSVRDHPQSVRYNGISTNQFYLGCL